VANAALYQFDLTGDYSTSWRLNPTVTADFSQSGGFAALYDVRSDGSRRWGLQSGRGQI